MVQYRRLSALLLIICILVGPNLGNAELAASPSPSPVPLVVEVRNRGFDPGNPPLVEGETAPLPLLFNLDYVAYVPEEVVSESAPEQCISVCTPNPRTPSCKSIMAGIPEYVACLNAGIVYDSAIKQYNSAVRVRNTFVDRSSEVRAILRSISELMEQVRTKSEEAARAALIQGVANIGLTVVPSGALWKAAGRLSKAAYRCVKLRKLSEGRAVWSRAMQRAQSSKRLAQYLDDAANIAEDEAGFIVGDKKVFDAVATTFHFALYDYERQIKIRTITPSELREAARRLYRTGDVLTSEARTAVFGTAGAAAKRAGLVVSVTTKFSAGGTFSAFALNLAGFEIEEKYRAVDVVQSLLDKEFAAADNLLAQIRASKAAVDESKAVLLAAAADYRKVCDLPEVSG